MENSDPTSESSDGDELTDEQKAELDRRRAAYEADPNNTISWEEVLAELEGEFAPVECDEETLAAIEQAEAEGDRGEVISVDEAFAKLRRKYTSR